MSGHVTIRGGRLVLPDRVVKGDVIVVDGVIEHIAPTVGRSSGEEIDAEGLLVLPGAVDLLSRLSMDEDGGDDESVAAGTARAVAAGVTSVCFLDPRAPATTRGRLHEQLAAAARDSRAHFGVYLVADPEHLDELSLLERAPGVRVRVGWARHGPAVGLDDPALAEVLESARRPVLVDGAAPEVLASRRRLYADSVDPREHGRIHSVDTVLPVLEALAGLARRHGTRMLLPRVTTPEELDVLDGTDLVGLCPVAHLWLDDEALRALGTRGVADPPLRRRAQVDGLREALAAGRVLATVTDHAWISASRKATPYPDTPEGLPTVDAWLPALLSLPGVKPTDVARWTSEVPARLLGLPRKGRLEVGYDGDLVLVDPDAPVSLGARGPEDWSPFEGLPLRGRPVMTILRGRPVYRQGRFVDGVRGRELVFPAM